MGAGASVLVVDSGGGADGQDGTATSKLLPNKNQQQQHQHQHQRLSRKSRQSTRITGTLVEGGRRRTYSAAVEGGRHSVTRQIFAAATGGGGGDQGSGQGGGQSDNNNVLTNKDGGEEGGGGGGGGGVAKQEDRGQLRPSLPIELPPIWSQNKAQNKAQNHGDYDDDGQNQGSSHRPSDQRVDLEGVVVQKLGAGAFGQVWKVKISQVVDREDLLDTTSCKQNKAPPPPPPPSSMDVAMKVMKPLINRLQLAAASKALGGDGGSAETATDNTGHGGQVESSSSEQHKQRLLDMAEQLLGQLAECKILALCSNHRNVIRLYDVDADIALMEARIFMELAEGDDAGSLVEVLHTQPDHQLNLQLMAAARVSSMEGLFVVLFNQLASALQHIHTRCGIMHQDLKLDNVMLAKRPSTGGAMHSKDGGGGGEAGGKLAVKLIDFGLANRSIGFSDPGDTHNKNEEGFSKDKLGEHEKPLTLHAGEEQEAVWKLNGCTPQYASPEVQVIFGINTTFSNDFAPFRSKFKRSMYFTRGLVTPPMHDIWSFAVMVVEVLGRTAPNSFDIFIREPLAYLYNLDRRVMAAEVMGWGPEMILGRLESGGFLGKMPSSQARNVRLGFEKYRVTGVQFVRLGLEGGPGTMKTHKDLIDPVQFKDDLSKDRLKVFLHLRMCSRSFVRHYQIPASILSVVRQCLDPHWRKRPQTMAPVCAAFEEEAKRAMIATPRIVQLDKVEEEAEEGGGGDSGNSKVSKEGSTADISGSGGDSGGGGDGTSSSKIDSEEAFDDGASSVAGFFAARASDTRSLSDHVATIEKAMHDTYPQIAGAIAKRREEKAKRDQEEEAWRRNSTAYTLWLLGRHFRYSKLLDDKYRGLAFSGVIALVNDFDLMHTRFEEGGGASLLKDAFTIVWLFSDADQTNSSSLTSSKGNVTQSRNAVAATLTGPDAAISGTSAEDDPSSVILQICGRYRLVDILEGAELLGDGDDGDGDGDGDGESSSNILKSLCALSEDDLEAIIRTVIADSSQPTPANDTELNMVVEVMTVLAFLTMQLLANGTSWLENPPKRDDLVSYYKDDPPPLLAARMGSLTALKYLADEVRMGVLSFKGEAGQTALHIACQGGHEAVASVLLDRGAEANAAENLDGQTALHFAINNGHEGIVQMLLDKGAATDFTSSSGQTALHFASGGGHEGIVRMLLDKGAAIEFTSTSSQGQGQTALHFATNRGREAVVRLLLDRGAAIDATTRRDGLTALHFACHNGWIAIVRVLLDKGASAELKDKGGKTALDRATKYGRAEIVAMLQGR